MLSRKGVAIYTLNSSMSVSLHLGISIITLRIFKPYSYFKLHFIKVEFFPVFWLLVFSYKFLILFILLYMEYLL